MTTKQKIDPHKVTKPIQLLAAWLVGLILVDGSFLTAASFFESNSWERIILVVAAVLNVPGFLYSMFVLQTKFRPEMQEDIYYSQYLDKKTNKIITVTKDEKFEAELLFIKNQIAILVNSSLKPNQLENVQETKTLPKPRLGHVWKIGLNDNLENFEEIRSLLKKEGLPLSDIFGSSNSTKKPKGKVLSISRELDLESKKRIILLAHKMGMEEYNYLGEEEDEFIDEDILIGSYGTGQILITPELIKLLESSIEEIDLKYYESKKMYEIPF